ncbi:hypothetical protein DFH94DRAFT_621639 [Russula ochroleuca]|uniref:Uncharacterized protein n=1 Tax=Russula ochroleuca TaxID=152965 RepID=A0A9P5TE02_9AGAM|nr:hypothetical protein DFH94DRAFT_621639 [Russula ochroleuca]
MQTRYLRFQLQLVQYIAIVGPLARSLWSLEASQANAADIFIFWLAIASNLKDIFSKSSDTTGISQTLARQVTAIINRRYKAMIDESPSDIYFTAFFLDPHQYQIHSFDCYTCSDVLKKPTTMSVTLKILSIKQRPCDRDVDAAESVPHARAYTRVKAFLKQMLRDIVETVKLAGHDLDTSNPCHRLVAQLGSNRVVSDFCQQLLAFSRQEWPFTDPITHGNALTWWESLEQHPHACVLAMLAIKIFSVLVNSMPDERTGSKITWFNSPLRANQDVSTLVNMIQIGQWYSVHKKGGPKEKHRPVVKFRDMEKDLMPQSELSGSGRSAPLQRHDLHDSDDSGDSDDQGVDSSRSITITVDENDTFRVDDDVNLASEFLRNMLVTEPSRASTSGKAPQCDPTPKQPGHDNEAIDWDF